MVAKVPCTPFSRSFAMNAGLTGCVKSRQTLPGDNNFKCTDCSFRSSARQIHMRVHTRERPYICKFCAKTFIDPSGVRKHTHIHHGVHPPLCTVCGKAFLRPATTLDKNTNKKANEPRATDSSCTRHSESQVSSFPALEAESAPAPACISTPGDSPPTIPLPLLALGNDLGKYYKDTESLTGDLKYNLLTQPFTPSSDYNFPKMKMYNKNRSFQANWLQKYDGLVYSPSLQGGLCKYCLLFAKNRDKLGTFVNSPFTQLNKSSEKLGKHFGSVGGDAKKSHKDAMADALQFKAMMENKKQLDNRQLNTAAAVRVAENRDKLMSILKTVIFCARQNIPLRGHRDDTKYLNVEHCNPGNFQALLQFRVDAGDKVLEQHFKTSSKNCTYRSKSTQNELIELCGDHIRANLLAEICEAVFFAISADDVADAANKEQMSVVIRFVDRNDDIREEFMAFVACDEGTDGETLSNAILQMVQEAWGLNMENCRGQAYDGAGAMAGKMKEVSSRILNLYPKATYSHCASRVLNLCMVKSLSIQIVQNMMDLVDGVARFFSHSPKRQGALEKVIDEQSLNSSTNQSRVKLKEMCRTRWVERHDAFEVFRMLYLPVVRCLEDICGDNVHNWDRDTLKDARSYHLGLTQFQFIIALVTTHHIMAYSKALSVGLQGRGVDMVKAYRQIDYVTESLQDVRTFNEEWFAEASKLAEDVGVMPTVPLYAGQMQYRTNTPAHTAEEYFKRNLTIPLVDHLLVELQTRFTEHTRRATQALHLIPSVICSFGTVDTQVISELVDFYKDDLPSPMAVETEVHSWQIKWKGKSASEVPKTAAKTLKQTDKLFFPNIHCLMRLFCTMPVTSCECERSIRGLRRLQTYMRTTMCEHRMNGLLLMHIHDGVDLDLNGIIDDFARRNPRRTELMDILK